LSSETTASASRIHAAKLGRGDRLERWRKSNISPKWISP
jgi:hypothetical protein